MLGREPEEERHRDRGADAADRGHRHRQRRVLARQVGQHVGHHSPGRGAEQDQADRQLRRQLEQLGHRRSASSGEIRARLSIPIATPRGAVSTRRKSAAGQRQPEAAHDHRDRRGQEDGDEERAVDSPTLGQAPLLAPARRWLVSADGRPRGSELLSSGPQGSAGLLERRPEAWPGRRVLSAPNLDMFDGVVFDTTPARRRPLRRCAGGRADLRAGVVLKIDAARPSCRRPSANRAPSRSIRLISAAAPPAPSAPGTVSPARAERDDKLFAAARMLRRPQGTILTSRCACAGAGDRRLRRRRRLFVLDRSASARPPGKSEAARTSKTKPKVERPSGPLPKQLKGRAGRRPPAGSQVRRQSHRPVRRRRLRNRRRVRRLLEPRRTVQLPARRRRSHPRLGPGRRRDEGRRRRELIIPAEPRLRPGGSPPAIGPNER